MFHTETSNGYHMDIPYVFRSYKILKDINKGSFSAVLKVIDQITDKIYAAKVIPKKYIEEQELTYMLDNEIEILGKISHPNIVNLYEFFELESNNNEILIVLIEEFCSGGNLLNYVMTKGFSNEMEKRSIARDITSAIKYLHDEGIAHCDIKPDNILLDERKSGKLCDFNLSKFVSNINSTNRGGTYAYSAPELHKIEDVDFLKADIWSLGVTLFAVSQMMMPFSSVEEAFAGRLTINIPNQRLKRFTKKCLFVDPEKRATASELLDDPYLATEGEFEDDIEDSLFIAKSDMFQKRMTSPRMPVRSGKCENKNISVEINENPTSSSNLNSESSKQQSSNYPVIIFELGFDFEMQNENENESECGEFYSQNSNEYEEAFDEIDDGRGDYVIERYEDRIASNLLKVKYEKRAKKEKKKGNQTKK